MALYDVFQKAARTIFKIFDSLAHKVEYINVVKADGFSDPIKNTYPLKMIIETFAERDVQFLSFSALIQPTDVKGMVIGQDIRDQGIEELTTSDEVVQGSTTYSVIAYNTDPAGAVYTLLLRNV